MVSVSSRRRAVRNGGFTLPDVGPAASLCRHDCVGPVQRVPHTITREEEYIFDLQCAQRSVAE
jgi:hypothetical protein